MPVARRRRGQVTVQPTAPVQTNVPIDVVGPSQGLQQAQRGAISDAQQFAVNEINEANNLKIQTFQNRIEQEKIAIENDVLSTKGENALGSTERARERLQKFVADLEQETANDTQRDALTGLGLQGETQITRTSERHTNSEIENQKLVTYKSLSNNLIESSVLNTTDGNRLAQNSIAYEDASLAEAKRRGFDKEATDAFMLEKMTLMNSRIANKMIADERYQEAQDFMDIVDLEFGQVSTKASEQINESLEEGFFRVKTEEKLGDLMTKHDNYFDRLEEAKKIQDPEERKSVTDGLLTNQKDEKALMSAAQDSLYTQAAGFVEENPGKSIRSVIPANIWNAMSPTTRRALNRLSQTIGPEQKEFMDWNQFIAFNNLTDVELNKMSLVDLQSKYVTNFNSTYNKKAMDKWIAAKENIKEGKHLTRLKTTEEILIEQLAAGGFIKFDTRFRTPAQNQLLDRFTTRFNRSLNDWEDTNGRKPNEFETKQIVDSTVLIEGRTESGEVRQVVTFSEEEFKNAGLQFGEDKGQISRSDVNAITARIQGSRPNLGIKTDEFRRLVRRMAFAFLIDDKQLERDLLSGRAK